MLDVRDFGAVGDYNPTTETGADDRAAFINAIAAAIAAGKHLRIPPGNYRLSKAIIISGAVGLKIEASAFASLYYPSDDLTLIPDTSFGHSYTIVRSGFYFNGCRDVTIEGLEFVGGTAQELTYHNVGVGVYATRCLGMRMINCRARNGGSIYAQDAALNTGYTHDNAISVSGGIVTLTNAGDVNGAFHLGMVGRQVTIVNANNKLNDGRFTILSMLSSTKLTYANASAVDESAPSSTVVWAVNDGDDDTKLINCRTDNNRGVSYTGSGGTYQNCTFHRQMTPDQTGVPDAFSIVGTTVTLLDASASWDGNSVGKHIKIAGSTSASNDGIFQILTVTPKTQNAPGSLTYANDEGVTELAPINVSRWWIAGGERSGRGNDVGAIASSSGVVTFTASDAIFRPDDVGKTLCLTDATSIANNGNKVITRYISSTQVQYVQSGAFSEDYAKVFTVDGVNSTKGDSTIGPAIISHSPTSVAANTLTDNELKMVPNAYAGRILIDSVGRMWQVTSNTETAFTLNAGGASPTAGAYTVAAGSTYGSTHGIYYFAGRQRIKIDGCVFRGVRTTGVKVSGSTLPIHEVEVTGCVFDECGAAIIAGADNSQEHSNLNFHHNQLINCSTGRAGWNDQTAIGVLGSRNVKITHNQFHATHDLVASHVNGGSIGGFYGIFAGRYVAGVSQPLEDVMIDHNTFTSDPTTTCAGRIATAAIEVDGVGQRAKYRTSGAGGVNATLSKHDSGALTLTIAADAGTMTRDTGSYITDGVTIGSTLTMSSFVNGGNNVTKTVSAVTATVVTFTSNTGLVDETKIDAHYTTNIMALHDDLGSFSQQDVGSTIQICNAPDSGNNSTTGLRTKVGEFLVLIVVGTNSLYFKNTAGVGGGVSAGTYRINPKASTNARRGGSCGVLYNSINGYGSLGIATILCTAPEILGNVFNGMEGAIYETGSVSPHIAHNREITAGSNSARIRVSTTTAWPIVYDNFVTNGALAGGNLTSETGATRSDMGVGIDSGTSKDHPLLGKRGRAVATGGRAEMVFAFGSGHVDGDTLAVDDNVFTYKASSADNGTGGTFATAAGLIACIDHTARAANGLGSLGLDCTDYGAAIATPGGKFASAVATGHICIRARSATASADAHYIDTINVLNPTALVIPRNDSGGVESIQYSRGEGAAGPTPDKFVVWSMQTSMAGGVQVQADSDAAMTALAAGWCTVKNAKNNGCCEIVKHGTYTEVGGEEIRWTIS